MELQERFKKHAIDRKMKLQEKEHTSDFSKWSIVKAHDITEFFLKKNKVRQKSEKERRDLIISNIPESKRSDNKYIKEIRDDIVFCRAMYGFSDQEYFTYEVDKLSHKGRKTFVTMRGKYPFYYKFNNQNYIMYLNKKTEMYRKYKKFYGRDAVAIYDESDRDLFKAFAKKHPKFIFKPSDDSGGKGIEIFDTSNVDLDKIFDIFLSQGCSICEELIVQGEALAQFHPESVNTVRIVTFKNKDGSLDILWSFLRMGMGGSHTDNMSGGGLSAMIDAPSGIIYSTGLDYLGEEHMCHPDSGVQLVGFKMPEWDKALELLREISDVLPELRFVGWDLAYSKNGWVMIEGNSRPQCLSAQIPKYTGRLYQFEEMERKFDAGL